MNKVKELLEQYKFQYDKTYHEDGNDILCFYDKKWGENQDGSFNSATYFINLTENNFEVYNCPEEISFLRCLYNIKCINLKRIEQILIKLNKNIDGN